MLHLREELIEKATGLWRGIMSTPRACYGMMTKEAMKKIATIGRYSHATLQEHATAAQWLARVAYEHLSVQH